MTTSERGTSIPGKIADLDASWCDARAHSWAKLCVNLSGAFDTIARELVMYAGNASIDDVHRDLHRLAMPEEYHRRVSRQLQDARKVLEQAGVKAATARMNGCRLLRWNLNVH